MVEFRALFYIYIFWIFLKLMEFKIHQFFFVESLLFGTFDDIYQVFPNVQMVYLQIFVIGQLTMHQTMDKLLDLPLSFTFFRQFFLHLFVEKTGRQANIFLYNHSKCCGFIHYNFDQILLLFVFVSYPSTNVYGIFISQHQEICQHFLPFLYILLNMRTNKLTNLEFLKLYHSFMIQSL